MRHQRAQQGFALAEVAVAVAILGMIGTLTYGAFSGALQAQEKANAITARYHEIRQALLRMTKELSSAYITHHRNCDDPTTRSIFQVRNSGGGSRVDFNSFSNVKIVADANESDQLELSYFIGDNPESKNESALIRRAQARIDEDPEKGGRERVLATGVSNLQIEMYDSKEDRWEDTWDTSGMDQRDRMPMFVKVTMTAWVPDPKEPDGKGERKFVTQAKIHMLQPLLIPGANFSRCLD